MAYDLGGPKTWNWMTALQKNGTKIKTLFAELRLWFE